MRNDSQEMEGREAILVLNRPRDEWQPQATALPGQEKVVSSEPLGTWWKLGPQGRCSHCWKIPPQSRGELMLCFKPSSHPNLLPEPPLSWLTTGARGRNASASRWSMISTNRKLCILNSIESNSYSADGITCEFYFHVFFCCFFLPCSVACRINSPTIDWTPSPWQWS